MSTEAHHHPQPREYVRIAMVLGALTAAEVGVYYLEQGVGSITQTITVPALLLLSALKFYLVVAMFMHLRYEKRVLSRFFTTGGILAATLYLLILAALGAVAVF